MATTTAASSSPSMWEFLKESVLQTGKRRPWMLQYRSNSAFICATVSIAVFTDIFLYAVIVPVMPYTLTEKTGIDPDDVQHWNSILIAVYGASLLAFSPICGWFADASSSRRLPLMLGLIALAGSTIMLNIGTSMGVLVAGRLLQGMSAAVVWVVGLALLVDTVGQTDVGQAMGYVSMAMSLAVLLAPLLGGVVLDAGGYNAVFAMAYALIGVDILLRLVLVEKKVARRWEAPDEVADLQGAAAASTGYGTTTTDNDDDNDEKKKSTSDLPTTPDPAHLPTSPEKPSPASEPHPPTTSSPATTTPSTPTAPSFKKTRRHALPPTLSLLLSRRLTASLLGTLAVSTLLSSLDATLPLHVRQTFHWTPTGAGLIFLPLILPSFSSPLFGHLADRHSPRYPTVLGFLLTIPPLVLLRFVSTDAMRDKVVLCVLLVWLGVALAAIMPAIMAEITYVVAAKEARWPGCFGKKGAYAQAYGLFNMAWAGGALIGPIWAGYVREKAGFGTMGWSLAVFCAAAAGPVGLWCGGWIGGKEGREGEGETAEAGAAV